MIILSDSSNKVVGVFTDGTNISTIPDQSIPTPIDQIGKDPVLVIDLITKELSYNYVDRPLTDSEKITQSEQQDAAMLLALVTGGLM